MKTSLLIFFFHTHIGSTRVNWDFKSDTRPDVTCRPWLAPLNGFYFHGFNSFTSASAIINPLQVKSLSYIFLHSGVTVLLHLNPTKILLPFQLVLCLLWLSVFGVLRVAEYSSCPFVKFWVGRPFTVVLKMIGTKEELQSKNRTPMSVSPYQELVQGVRPTETICRFLFLANVCLGSQAGQAVLCHWSTFQRWCSSAAHIFILLVFFVSVFTNCKTQFLSCRGNSTRGYLICRSR